MLNLCLQITAKWLPFWWPFPDEHQLSNSPRPFSTYSRKELFGQV